MKNAWFAILMLGFLCGSVAAAFNTTQIFSNSDTLFRITNYQQSPDRMYPGDQVALKISLATTKTVAEEVIVKANTPLFGTDTVFSLGNMAKDEVKNLPITFTIKTGTKGGTYPIYIYARDKISPEKEIARIQLVVNEQVVPGLLVASATTQKTIRTGESADILIELKNTGVLPAQGVTVEIVSNESKPFTALGADRKFVGDIQGGKSETVSFTTGVAADAAPGFFPLTVLVRYSVDNVQQTPSKQLLGLKVQSRAEILITSDQQRAASGTTLTLTLANVGDTAVRGVFAKASSEDFRIQSAPEKFVGTLNLDDSSTQALTLVPARAGSLEGIVHITVTFKDSSNEEHTLEQDVVVSSEGTFVTGPAGTDAANANQRFLRNRQNGGFFGLNLVQWGLLIGGLLIAGFLGYRWYQGRKKK